MIREKVIIDLADMAEELCQPHRHSEPIYDRDKWRNKRMARMFHTTQDGLLAQLRQIGHEGLKVGSGGPTPNKPESKPPGCFEAFARHVYIAVEAGRWAVRLGLENRMRPEDNIHGIVGKAPNLGDDDLAQLHREVRYWHRQAASATGWASLPYTPPVRCPNCQQFGSLRVGYRDDPKKPTAYCTNPARDQQGVMVCAVSWTEDTVTALVEYVRRVTDPVAVPA